ncbi:MAG TPA: hypothetical protein PK819_05525 [Thermomicrobiales bacterium]|nr:hypothetical protein [Thermomicrobiales bacterium]
MSRLLAGIALIGILLLAGCGGNSKPATPTNSPAAQEKATLEPVAGNVATDGQCQITIPDTWVDYGTGRGQTQLGDRWTVFGGAVTGNTGWTSVVDLAKTQLGGPESSINETETSIVIIQPANRGYLTRVRFDNRYCEFSVITSADRSEDVLQTWTNVAVTLQIRV